MDSSATRSVRCDAFSSGSRIIEAARGVFSSGEGEGTLNRIAQEAGVGIATLYRHFPNRQALAWAVYDRIFTTEVEPLFARIGATEAPRETLLEIAERLSDIAGRERGLVASIGNLTEATTELLRRHSESFAPILQRAQAAGNVRPDIEPADIPNILAMVVTGVNLPHADDLSRRRYLSLLLDALNPARATSLPQ
ncbi:TetR family transcriptional regulator [Kocuria sp. WN036]|uniref:TetR/AcrR family transcriptional regulator n=1 Tax=Kocuria TaxID=57493 RepID=UPI000BABFA49|nr:MULTISPECIES: TetR/AcrR family transcriptional regulator [Kocuria]NVC25453.1 TetR/AcrR family transcriptional regulator [Kocuria salina]PAU90972.1 TetR family transcriptional regulator [Kocuria sp. WN036]THE18990.1 TetR/AcrR family transcriptional regulator [Kocuria rosea]